MQTSDQVAGEARQTLASKIAHSNAWAKAGGFTHATVLLTDADATLIIDALTAALRAQPQRGAEEWNYDMSAAPKGPGCPVLVSVPSFAKGHAPFVGEAYYHEDEPNEGWWWAGTSPGDYWASPVKEVNAEPIAWRHLPEPAAIRALPLHPDKDEGGGR